MTGSVVQSYSAAPFFQRISSCCFVFLAQPVDGGLINCERFPYSLVGTGPNLLEFRLPSLSAQMARQIPLFYDLPRVQAPRRAGELPERRLLDGDDGLLAEAIKLHTRQKHTWLGEYVRLSAGVRKKFVGPGKAGAAFIDLFCSTGRCFLDETGEWVDGSAVAAWLSSVDSNAPFSQVLVGDVDARRRQACVERLRRLGAPVVELTGEALVAVRQVRQVVNPAGLRVALLDPYSLRLLDFALLRALAQLARPDLLGRRNSPCRQASR